MKIKIAVTLALIVLVGAGVGCRHNVNTSNPAVVTASALQDASNACVTLEDGLTAADKALDQLETVEPEYYAHVKPLLKKISAANASASKIVQSVKNGQPGNVKGAMLAVAVSVTPADLTAFSVKNPTSQLIVEGSITALIATLATIQANFGGSK